MTVHRPGTDRPVGTAPAATSGTGRPTTGHPVLDSPADGPPASGSTPEASTVFRARTRHVIRRRHPDDLDPHARADSALRKRVERFALGRWGLAFVVAWAVAEAVLWPLVPELAVFALVLAAPRAGWRLVPASVVASMAGGLVTLALGAHGLAPDAPLVTDRMRDTVRAQTADEGAAAVRHQPLAGIPFKVYAAEAGQAGVAPAGFVASAVTHRGTRIALVGTLCSLGGLALRRRPHRYPAVLLTVTGAFAVGLAIVVIGWS